MRTGEVVAALDDEVVGKLEVRKQVTKLPAWVGGGRVPCYDHFTAAHPPPGAMSVLRLSG